MTSPFPYDGTIPNSGQRFLDAKEGGQPAHTSPRGGVYPQDPTYSDRDVLLAIPPRFEPSRAAIVVYLHGNLARLQRDIVTRQQVVTQLAGSGLDAALVAPQFALDALDSSAGHFWDEGGFADFMAEAAEKLGALSGRPADAFAALPVVLVAYSGGYNPAAAILTRGGAPITGVILLDALYGEGTSFANWIARSDGAAFFVSAYSPSSASGNLALEADLRGRGIGFVEALPSRIDRGTVAFVDAGPVTHTDFVTRAWTDDPLRDALSRVRL